MIKEIKLKYTKYQKRKLKKITWNNNKLDIRFGDFGIMALEPGRLTKNQIEAFRKQLRRNLKKKLKLWIKIKPNRMLTKKSSGTRMGKGKGYDYNKICNISAGQIIFEISCSFVKTFILMKIFKSAISKLMILCKIICLKY